MLYFSKINHNDINNGIGVRVSIFFSGCSNHCKGCFQPETWNPTYGKEFNIEYLYEIFKQLKKDYISGITFLGGDPFYPDNVSEVCEIAKHCKYNFPNKTIWCYSGYTYEELLKRKNKDNLKLLNLIDILVDGRFEIDKKDLKLAFRGSSNQRIIDLNKTREENKIINISDRFDNMNKF